MKILKLIFQMLLAALFGIFLTLAFYTFFILAEDLPPLPSSSVKPADCALCGTPNVFRGVDTIAILDIKGFKIHDIGMAQFCRNDAPEEACILMNFDDRALSPEELAHKYAPFDINGAMRAHPSKAFYAKEAINPLGNAGTTGYIERVSEANLVNGTLDLSGQIGADPEYLSSMLCQSCFDKVYALTATTDLIFLDCLTNGVYPICGPEKDIQIRNYSINRTAQGQMHAAFTAAYPPPGQEPAE